MAARVVYTAIHIGAANTGRYEANQSDLSAHLRMSRRHLQSGIKELIENMYLEVVRGKDVSTYVLPWAPTAFTAQPSAQSELSNANGNAQPSAQSNGYFNKEERIQEKPPAPFGERTRTNCGVCRGLGITQRIFRGQAANQRCEACGGTGQALPEAGRAAKQERRTA